MRGSVACRSVVPKCVVRKFQLSVRRTCRVWVELAINRNGYRMCRRGRGMQDRNAPMLFRAPERAKDDPNFAVCGLSCGCAARAAYTEVCIVERHYWDLGTCPEGLDKLCPTPCHAGTKPPKNVCRCGERADRRILSAHSRQRSFVTFVLTPHAATKTCKQQEQQVVQWLVSTSQYLRVLHTPVLTE